MGNNDCARPGDELSQPFCGARPRDPGEHRAVEAAQAAISSPLLETAIEGARGILFNITGGSDLALSEVYEAADVIFKTTDEREANIIFGTVIDERFDGIVQVTVIATGFGGARTVSTDRMMARDRIPVRSVAEELDIPAFLRRR